MLTAFITLPAGRYREDGKRVATYDEIERRMASLPGVRSVGGTSHLPLSGQDSRTGIVIENREPTPDTPTRAHPRAVTIDYFKTMGIRLVSGRNFAVTDHSESPFVVDRQRDDGAALLAGRLPARQAPARIGAMRRSRGAKSSAS